MSALNFLDIAKQLPDSWKSSIQGRVGDARIKVLRMDGQPYPDECHVYTEALIVLDGELRLTVQGNPVTVETGSAYLVPPNTPHGVAAGSFGTLLIIDI